MGGAEDDLEFEVYGSYNELKLIYNLILIGFTIKYLYIFNELFNTQGIGQSY